MASAAHVGINISDFWEMTPRELCVYVDAYTERVKNEQDNMMIYAYMGAYLGRVKKMPQLKEFIDRKESKPKTAEDILEEIRRMNASFGGNTY